MLCFRNCEIENKVRYRAPKRFGPARRHETVTPATMMAVGVETSFRKSSVRHSVPEKCADRQPPKMVSREFDQRVRTVSRGLGRQEHDAGSDRLLQACQC